jgi:hypothetical protein
MNADKKTYLNKVMTFASEDVVKEIKEICKELKVEPRKYLIFRDTGGLHYMLGVMAGDIYFSMQPIDPEIRFKLAILMLCCKTTKSVCNIFEINRNQKPNKNDYWLRDQYAKDLEEVKKHIISTVESWDAV